MKRLEQRLELGVVFAVQTPQPVECVRECACVRVSVRVKKAVHCAFRTREGLVVSVSVPPSPFRH